MKKGIFYSLGLLLVLLLGSCGPTAYIQQANNTNFSNYRTFAWAQQGKKHRTPGIVEQRIRDAISDNLTNVRGWQQVTRNPDIILSYDVLVQRGSRLESDPRYAWGGFRTFYNPYAGRFFHVYYPTHFVGYDTYRVPVRKGTVAITMVDGRNDRNVLQGWATEELNERRITPELADRLVTAIFKKWKEPVTARPIKRM